MLTKEKEKELIYQFKSGNENALELLLKEFTPLILKYMYKYGMPTNEYEKQDFYTVAQTGFYKALLKFDLEKQNRLATYSKYHIMNELIAYKAKTIGIPVEVYKKMHTLTTLENEFVLIHSRIPSEDELVKLSEKYSQNIQDTSYVLSLKDIKRLKKGINFNHTISIDKEIEEDNRSFLDIHFGSYDNLEDDNDLLSITKKVVYNTNVLNPREKLIIHYYRLADQKLSQKEIATLLNSSCQCVSYSYKKAINKLSQYFVSHQELLDIVR